ncbi:MAG: hypothetical protein ACYCU7_08135 [Acidimicrobiales bacterium]
MVAVVVGLVVVVLLLSLLVAGLLRSHADILRALHSLGAGVGDPALDDGGPAGSGPVPVTIGPPLPPERNAVSAPTVAGVTPTGEAMAVPVGSSGGPTLLAFLSSGCATCATFWQALSDGSPAGLPSGVRVLVVTKGPELEAPVEVATRAGRATVVMSTEAWSDYEVPGSPFFALVDGHGRRVGEGVANHLGQLADLVRRATAESPGAAAAAPALSSRRVPPRESGPQREESNDRALREAGIAPGDPSLYPRTLEELHGNGRPERQAG